MVVPKLKYNKTSDGKYAHVKTWELFHGKKRTGYQIHHIDGNPTNNSISNLVELKTNYHQLYHKLAKILNKTIKQMNVYIGMQPCDNSKFYSKLDNLAKKFNVDVDTSDFAKRRKTGSGLSRDEYLKKRMVITGKARIAKGEPAWKRDSAEETNTAKENAKKYFGSVDAYTKACRN